jgi:hypothetical protein
MLKLEQRSEEPFTDSHDGERPGQSGSSESMSTGPPQSPNACHWCVQTALSLPPPLPSLLPRSEQLQPPQQLQRRPTQGHESKARRSCSRHPTTAATHHSTAAAQLTCPVEDASDDGSAPRHATNCGRRAVSSASFRTIWSLEESDQTGRSARGGSNQVSCMCGRRLAAVRHAECNGNEDSESRGVIGAHLPTTRRSFIEARSPSRRPW